MIDVIIPTKNSASVIEPCLLSLSKQTVPVHMIIVDAHSTDETLDIATAFGCSIYQEPLSKVKGSRRAVACNEGLRHVTSKFVGFLDSDTEIPPTWAEDMENTMIEYENGAVEDDINNPIPIAGITSGCEPDISTSLSKSINFVMKLGSTHAQKFNGTIYLDSLPGYNAIYRKDVIDKVGEYNEELGGCEDLEYNTRIRKMGYKLLGIPKSPVKHYERKNYLNFFKQIKGYGWSMGRLYHIKREIPKTRFLPLIFMISLLVIIVMLPVLLLGIVFCFSFIFFNSFLKKIGWFYLLLSIPVFLIMQTAYSIGFVKGVID